MGYSTYIGSNEEVDWYAAVRKDGLTPAGLTNAIREAIIQSRLKEVEISAYNNRSLVLDLGADFSRFQNCLGLEKEYAELGSKIKSIAESNGYIVTVVDKNKAILG